MLKLENVTLICADCFDVNRAIEVIEKCKSRIEFGAIKLLTSIETDYEHAVKIMPLNSLLMYSIFCLKEMYKYSETSHYLIVQKDGWVINPESWNPEWLNYDYLAPLFNSYEPPRMGAGGFSLRSTKMMQNISSRVADWDGTEQDTERVHSLIGLYEDGHIALVLKDRLERAGYRFATPEDGSHFAAGGNYNKQYYVERPFGFHQGDYFYQCKEMGTDTGIIPVDGYSYK